MKDLTITYKNGKYQSLVIDGMTIDGVESFSLSGSAGELSRLTLTMPITRKEMVGKDQDRDQAKPLKQAIQDIPYGGFPASDKLKKGEQSELPKQSLRHMIEKISDARYECGIDITTIDSASALMGDQSASD